MASFVLESGDATHSTYGSSAISRLRHTWFYHMVTTMSTEEHASRPRRLLDIVTEIYYVLEPLDPTTRAKALRTVATMFDDENLSLEQREKEKGHSGAPGSQFDKGHENSAFTSGRRATAWLRKNGISDEQLERVFHLEAGAAQLFATIPGTKKREQTVNAYLLVAAQSFLATDEPRFTDAQAVELCKRVGCYDMANHAQTRSTFGNRFSGSKESGYVLTPPGQDQAASLIKAMAVD